DPLHTRVTSRRPPPRTTEGPAYETQVIAGVISSDPQVEAAVHGITAASTALTISDIPFNGPIAGVRVGRVNGEFVANPSAAQRQESDLDLIMAASKDAIVMVEGGAEEFAEADMVAALEFGKTAVQPVLELQLAMREELGTKTRSFEVPAAVPEALVAKVRALAFEDVKKAYLIPVKGERYTALSAAKKA